MNGIAVTPLMLGLMAICGAGGKKNGEAVDHSGGTRSDQVVDI